MGFISDLTGATNNYKAQAPMIDQNNYQSQINKALQNPLNMDNSAADQTRGRQIGLEDALTAQMQGKGPSLAQNQLQAGTDRAMMQSASAGASQRGSNPTLAARQILQNQAAENQQGAQQSAALKQQEQINATASLGNVLGGVRQQDINQSTSNSNANIAGLNTLGGLEQGQNQVSTQGQLGASSINAGVEAQNSKTRGGIAGGLLSSIGGGMAMAHGGVVKMADGGMLGIEGIDSGSAPKGPSLGVDTSIPAPVAPQGVSSVASVAPSPIQSGGGGGSAIPSPSGDGGNSGEAIGKGIGSFFTPKNPMGGGGGGDKGGGGGGGGIGSSIGSFLPMLMALLSSGGKVPGIAHEQGDNSNNDTVPAMLSPGEIVIPRSHSGSKEMAKEFVDHIMNQKHVDEPKGYSKVLDARRKMMNCGGKAGY